MGLILVKPERGTDLYVIWSTYTDSPIFYGDRAETFTELGGDVRPGRCPTCHSHIPETQTPSYRLRVADEYGSEARRYGWDKTEFFYRQAGMLARADLAKAVDLECAGRGDLVLELLVEARRRAGLTVAG